jgi:hypothetical protein
VWRYCSEPVTPTHSYKKPYHLSIVQKANAPVVIAAVTKFTAGSGTPIRSLSADVCDFLHAANLATRRFMRWEDSVDGQPGQVNLQGIGVAYAKQGPQWSVAYSEASESLPVKERLELYAPSVGGWIALQTVAYLGEPVAIDVEGLLSLALGRQPGDPFDLEETALKLTSATESSATISGSLTAGIKSTAFGAEWVRLTGDCSLTLDRPDSSLSGLTWRGGWTVTGNEPKHGTFSVTLTVATDANSGHTSHTLAGSGTRVLLPGHWLRFVGETPEGTDYVVSFSSAQKPAVLQYKMVASADESTSLTQYTKVSSD